jgi:protein-tyrosine phosphatase
MTPLAERQGRKEPLKNSDCNHAEAPEASLSAASRILFVCTGNIFRSLAAEYAVRRALGAQSPICVSSAGTDDFPHVVKPIVEDYLLRCGLDVRNHQRRTLTERLLSEATLVIGMNHDHRAFIRERYGRDVPLFMEVCGQKDQALPDVEDVIPDYIENEAAVEAHVRRTIDRIIELSPSLAQRLLEQP